MCIIGQGYILPPILDLHNTHGQVCIVILGMHLGAVDVLAICIVGCLVHIWCKRGVALVKFQTFPISYGVMEHNVYFTGHVRIDKQVNNKCSILIEIINAYELLLPTFQYARLSSFSSFQLL